jgi:N-acetylmuramoyl-L-alanine amidase
VEKDLVLRLAKQLQGELSRRGLKVVMTRVDDTFVSLEERFAIANDARGDLFVSIHANASPDTGAHGSEVYFYASIASDEDAGLLASRENAALRASALDTGGAADPVLVILGDMKRGAYEEESARFARLAESGLAGMRSSHSRGVKQAPFVVLNGQMPASLVEVGFLTHKGEEKRMRSTNGQKQIVAALADAVLEYGRFFDKKWEAR